METETDVRPVRPTVCYLDFPNWDCEGSDKRPSGDVDQRIGPIAKWGATSNGLVAGEFSTHSLRIGWDTATYVRVISIEHMRRFIRRASDTCRRYLYHDDQVFLFVGSAMVLAAGLLGQLQMANPGCKTAHFAERNVDGDEDKHFRAGGKKAANHYVNPPLIPPKCISHIRMVGELKANPPMNDM